MIDVIDDVKPIRKSTWRSLTYVTLVRWRRSPMGSRVVPADVRAAACTKASRGDVRESAGNLAERVQPDVSARASW